MGWNVLTITCSLLELSFCSSNIIYHFGCEYSALSLLPVLTPISVNLHVSSFYTQWSVCSLLIILTSYVFIILTIIKMPSAGELQKAFSTCASHLSTVTIFHGTVLFLYCVPNSKSSWLLVKVATVCFTGMIPMLNPLIYSLRNVKKTVRSLITMKLLSPSI